MQCFKTIAALALCVFANTSCKFGDDSSRIKEFEFSSNICQDIQSATDSRWTAASGKTKEEFHRALISQERQIIAYELPRYQQRLSDIQSNSGPANGPTAQVQPLATAPSKNTPDSPSDASTPSAPAPTGDTNTTTTDQGTGFDLQESRAYSTDALAKEVCPGCTLEQVEAKIRVLQHNHTNLSS
jgi:hypothetical protein